MLLFAINRVNKGTIGQSSVDLAEAGAGRVWDVVLTSEDDS